ncbi:MAG: DMT family transporter [Chloroflexi bacterium]|nr:DMT family transporter [Chloroflexota bacterium]
MSHKPLALASQSRLINNAPLVVICLLIVDSLHFVFARALLPYLPPTTSAMYILGLATVEVAVFLALWDTIDFAVFRRYAWFFLTIGQPGEFIWVGVLMVIISTFLYTLHAALVKRHGDSIGLTDFFLFRLVCTSAFLLVFTLGRGELVLPGWPVWLLLLLAATVDVTISRTLYYLTLRRLNLSLHAIILTLSPAIAVLWTLFLFGVVPTLQQLIGGIAVIAGVLMVSLSQARG